MLMAVRLSSLAPHASRPFNPDIANAFFRAGEIEAWGRGIERIFTACREAGLPVPNFRFDGSGLWTEFAFAAEYLQSVQAKAPMKTPMKTSEQLLTLLRERPMLTLAEAAASLGKSSSAVARAAKKLREEGQLRYVGPQKGGHWEIME